MQTDIEKCLYNHLLFQDIIKYSEKAPGGGVFIFASLSQNWREKTPPPGVISANPLYFITVMSDILRT